MSVCGREGRPFSTRVLKIYSKLQKCLSATAVKMTFVLSKPSRSSEGVKTCTFNKPQNVPQKVLHFAEPPHPPPLSFGLAAALLKHCHSGSKVCLVQLITLFSHGQNCKKSICASQLQSVSKQLDSVQSTMEVQQDESTTPCTLAASPAEFLSLYGISHESLTSMLPLHNTIRYRYFVQA